MVIRGVFRSLGASGADPANTHGGERTLEGVTVITMATCNEPAVNVVCAMREEGSAVGIEQADGSVREVTAGVVTLDDLVGRRFEVTVSLVGDRPCVTAITVAAAPGAPLRVRDVQQVQMGRVFDAAIGSLTQDHPPGWRWRPGYRFISSKNVSRPRRPDLTAADHKATARLYERARAANLATGPAVAAGLGVSHNTARQRIRRARLAGFLPPAAT